MHVDVDLGALRGAAVRFDGAADSLAAMTGEVGSVLAAAASSAGHEAVRAALFKLSAAWGDELSGLAARAEGAGAGLRKTAAGYADADASAGRRFGGG
jgi:uncharacterized protein YukE